jgi:hypothetical protein
VDVPSTTQSEVGTSKVIPNIGTTTAIASNQKVSNLPRLSASRPNQRADTSVATPPQR